QNYKVRGGAYTREHFFGKHPELADLVAHMTDDEIWQLDRGGHDPVKIHAAYERAVNHTGQPTVILAKTVKGYGMGEAGEGMNISHQQKKMGENSLRAFRDRYRIPIPDDKLPEAPFYKPADDAPEIRYMHERRQALGGYLPARHAAAPPLEVPPLAIFEKLLEGSGEREYSTTMAFVRLLSSLVRDKKLARYLVPIVADEARTFGMEGLFRQLGIYAAEGQKYEPVDSDQVMYYREDEEGQILQEGISEAGAMSSWIAAATSYAQHGVPMIPFYAFYSMFGPQRVGDLFWAAGDSRARGFLIAGTAGRTTLAGEGLQHQDGHSQLWVSSIPNCVSYDPAFAYELAVIVHHGLERMLQRREDVFFYLTVMNENYEHPAMPAHAPEGILRGMYRFRDAPGAGDDARRVQLLGSGSILREVLAAADLLREDWGVAADVWSVTSFTELRRDGLEAERWSLLHPAEPPRRPYATELLEGRPGPVVAATDWVKAYADQIRPFVPAPYRVLGTDGFGRSDQRDRLRRHFEVSRHFVTVAALKSLADAGALARGTVRQAIERYKIDPDKPAPATS
ncbi:MAG TPA: pyruvate dehydrogenase (acetyl-transferring), homodimeric type, partial [Myxococcota bacterium]|nr:pyruvate dehydrogenase (acetyl-transferring), homodimeric type [Myxococcota bacterium]